MRRSIATLAFGLAALTPTHAFAQTVVAAWDFSLYFGSGGTVVDSSFENVFSIDAQFSALDTDPIPTPGLGDSAAFGTMFHDGSFGSTDDDPGNPFLPGALTAITGELTSNSDATSSFSLQMSTSGARNALVGEGQEFGNELSIGANAPVSVVFEANRSGAPGLAPGSSWTLSFGGIVIPSAGAPSTLDVVVEFSEDGGSYSQSSTATLGLVEEAFEIALGESTSDQVFARVNLPAFARIDNVAVSVPEPSAAAAALGSLLALSGLNRRRTRSGG